jgi:hypothetical protein
MSNGLGEFRELTKDLKIKISGCPNACAQHVTASIGFQGASLSKDGRNVPAEQVFIGGGLYGDDTRLATSIIKVPTRNAPKVVKRLIELYRDEKQGEEHFDIVMERLGRDRLKDEINHFTEIPTFEEDPSFYDDWGHEEEKFEYRRAHERRMRRGDRRREDTHIHGCSEADSAGRSAAHDTGRTSIMESYHSCAASAHAPHTKARRSLHPGADHVGVREPPREDRRSGR